MEKILLFDNGKMFDEPTLQYSGSDGDNTVITLTGPTASRVYVDIRKKELILQYGSWAEVPDFFKTKLALLVR